MRRSAALAALPLLLVALLIAGFVVWRPFDFLSVGVPPTEELVVERVVLDGDGIHAYVRAQGSAPLSIAQVQVDSAYRVFTMTPARSARPFCDRAPRHLLSLGHRRSPYHPPPDQHRARRSTTRSRSRPPPRRRRHRASPPWRSSASWWASCRWPSVWRSIPPCAGQAQGVWRFLLGLTVGLLAFLLFDTVREGLEVAEGAIGGLGAASLFWSAAALSLIVLLALGRRQGRSPEGMALAFFIAIGIGLHNLGRGTGHRRLARHRQSSARFLPGARFRNSQHHRGSGHRRADRRDPARARHRSRPWRRLPACRPLPARSSAPSPMRRTWLRWLSVWRPARSCRSSSRSASIWRAAPAAGRVSSTGLR